MSESYPDSHLLTRSPSYAIRLSSPEMRDYEWSSRREWLTANGIGGYASASVAGSNTRRYHGLLVAALTPPTGRTVVLSRVEETLDVNGQHYELAANQYPGVVHPQGFQYLAAFEPWPSPSFEYELPCGARLRKRIWMTRGENTTCVSYELTRSENRAELTLVPLICWKGYHAEMAAHEGFPDSVRGQGHEVAITLLAGQPALHMQVADSEWFTGGCWYYSFEHLRELERGLDWREDLFAPGRFTVSLQPGASVTLTATLEESPAHSAGSWEALIRHQRDLMHRATGQPAPLPILASDAFVVDGGIRRPGPVSNAGSRRPPRSTIMAGYPWFADWGRDTMIALPGLCLTTRRFETAREILRSYAGFMSQGMIPNRFPDSGEEPEYNTADATLWFVNAIWEWLQAAGGSDSFAREMWPYITETVDWHVRGTRWGIRVDPMDGLLHAGEPGTQLTWMDARVDGRSVTPRIGKPVEINSLWHNALCIAAGVAEQLGESAGLYRKLAARTAKGFRREFPRRDGLGLYDVLTDVGGDASIRPNQVFAVSLPFPPLPESHWRPIMDVVQRELLTPVGLRTLARGDPRYHGRYSGGPAERDSAYHQGTVWPWLLGPFVQAYLKVYHDPAVARSFLAPLLDEMAEYGVGYLPEVYDGDPPHKPGGCIAQAWSVAAALAALD